eukprot:9116529-Pyramimonas_sp.AAC.1
MAEQILGAAPAEDGPEQGSAERPCLSQASPPKDAPWTSETGALFHELRAKRPSLEEEAGAPSLVSA